MNKKNTRPAYHILYRYIRHYNRYYADGKTKQNVFFKNTKKKFQKLKTIGDKILFGDKFREIKHLPR